MDKTFRKELSSIKQAIHDLQNRLVRIEEFISDLPVPSEYLYLDKKSLDFDRSDPLLLKAVEVIRHYDKASASLLQRRLSIGYARAARLLDILHQLGLVSVARGAKPSTVNQDKIKAYLAKQS